MTASALFWAIIFLADPAPALTTYNSNFYVIESNLPPPRVAEIGRIMDATGREYDRRFQGFPGKVKTKPKIKVFAKREEYIEAVKRATEGSRAAATSGVFVPLDQTVYTFDSPFMEHVLRHECFHQFVHFVVGGRMDPWVNEGLAEYFAMGEMDRLTGVLRLGRSDSRRAAQLLDAKENHALMSVHEILTMSRRDWHANMGTEDAGTQYAQAWALCHFLIHGDGGKYQKYFDEYLRLVDKHLDGPTAFKRAFGEDLTGLQQKYLAYIDQLISAGAFERALGN